MSKNKNPENLEQLLDQIGKGINEEDDQVFLEDILEVVGRRSFGPLLLVAGVITMTPVIGDIPGVPTIMGCIVFLIAIQLLFRAKHFWLPDILLKRSAEPVKVRKGVEWIRPPAKFIDGFLRPRLTIFTEGPAIYVIAVICLVIAVSMPLIDVVPFSGYVAGLALTAFGLSIMAHDGLVALLALLFTAATAVVVIFNLF